MIERIEFNGEVYGLKVSNENPENTKFYTDKDMDIQMGLVCHKKGYIEPAHIHKQWDRNIINTTEVLYVIDGKCRINFFDKKGNKLGFTDMIKGEFIFLKGHTGHNLETLEDFKGFKAKQGPYVDIENDKVLL